MGPLVNYLTQKSYTCFLLYKASNNGFSYPFLWANAKTYYEEYGHNISQWNWGTPNLNYNDNEQLIESILAGSPTVIGFSIYSWNIKQFIEIARIIKSKNSNITIVFGGPHCDIKYNANFFKDYPYIDLVIPSDSYGEIAWAEILDNISKNGELYPHEIHYSYWPSAIDQTIQYNSLPINKREFQWPDNVFAAQHALIDIDYTSQVLTIETSRGCPYKCTFCDWGGGTHTKTVKKPDAIVRKELTWIAENHVYAIYIADANFGIFDIDVEYAEYLVELNKLHGYPKQVWIEPTKAKFKNLKKIYASLASADMIVNYKISVQDLNQHVKDNVERVDFDFHTQIAFFKELQAIKDLPIWVEGILGLPGSSLSTMKNDIHTIISEGIDIHPTHWWMLMPDTPAAMPDYIEKFKIKTMSGKKSAASSTFDSPVRLKSGHENKLNCYTQIDPTIDCNYVISTISYSSDEWIDMDLLQVFVSTVHNTKILSLVADYMFAEHTVKYGDFYSTVLDKIFTTFEDPIKGNFIRIKEAYYDLINGVNSNIFLDFDHDFPYTIARENFILLTILTNADSFFSSLSNMLSTYNDPATSDLCNFARQQLLDHNYAPNRTFDVKYDWMNYKPNNLIKVNKTLQIQDTVILTYHSAFSITDYRSGGTELDITWDSSYNSYIDFFYKVCFDIRTIKTCRNILELN